MTLMTVVIATCLTMFLLGVIYAQLFGSRVKTVRVYREPLASTRNGWSENGRGTRETWKR